MTKWFLMLLLVFSSTQAMADLSDTQTTASIHLSLLSHLEDPQTYMCYIEASRKDGWYAADGWSKNSLNGLIDRYVHKKGLIIPIFPTVYSPGSSYQCDLTYYNYILKESGIKKNDKVLVLGSGSGSDSWVAWLRAQSLVYAVDINPLAVANTKATAQIGVFPVKVIEGDIRTMEFPKDFSNFDYILSNLPFVQKCDYAGDKYYDCDNGKIFEKFLALLPRLLKKGGKAIFYNSHEAMNRVQFLHKKIIKGGNADFCSLTQNAELCIITND